MKKFLNEFKGFILKGNVLDLAVGVIIGAAFGKIVSSLVNDILMPLISLIAQRDITDWRWLLRDGVNFNIITGVWEQAPIYMNYGNFIKTIIDFVIIGFVLFVIVKAALASSKLREKIKPAVTAKPE